MSQSLEIIDIFEDAARQMSGMTLTVTDYNGATREQTADVNYIFGSAKYFKDYLDDATMIGKIKFPALVLFTPIIENRNDPRYYSIARVNLLIAFGTQQAWNNEQRKTYSFENVLRPLYHKLLDVLAADKRLDFGYSPNIRHDYTENYSYGKYGAYVDRSGEMVSEPIDAIDIHNLELRIKPINCRLI